MKPVNKYILIDPITEEVKTNSGLLLSSDDKNQFRYKKANVVETSDLVETIKKGDSIYYDKAQAHEVIIKDASYVVIQERDVVVVL
ncbi:MAG: putative chaperonin 10 Kd subunit [Prokaryotic dsDNA virus sp.]|nr:MAG: putative chaperonin 10 Kd subunit [Prokaryotic dsDNA virus sp.]|tara:strand:- start:8698 stop:8955 length:258 start_codon:yes stop_codon:yes gene_type:complete